MNLNKLRDEAYSIAKANGWHEEEHSDEHWLMLVISEIAEAVQADRKNKHADIAKFKEWQGNSLPLSEETRIRRFKEDFEAYIENTVESELADIVIRCMDFSGLHGFDLQSLFNEPVDGDVLEEMFSGKTFAEIAFRICDDIFFSTAEAATYRVIYDVVQYCQFKGIDLDFFIRTKMNYNRLRGYHHGGKKY